MMIIREFLQFLSNFCKLFIPTSFVQVVIHMKIVCLCLKERREKDEMNMQSYWFFCDQIGHLVSSVSTVKDFMFNWLEFGEKIGHMAMEGDAEDDDDLSF